MNAVVKPELEAQTARFLAQTHKLFINNEWVEPQSGQMIDVINPATGKVIRRRRRCGSCGARCARRLREWSLAVHAAGRAGEAALEAG